MPTPPPANRPQPPPRSPFLLPVPPPPPPPQRPPPAPALQQRAWAGLTLAVLSLLAMMLISNLQRAAYVITVAVIFAAIGLALTISAMSAAKRSGSRRPRGAWLGTALGVIGVGVGGSALIGFLLFSAQFNQYSACINAAGSATAAQNACQTQLNKSVGREIGILGHR